MGGRKVSFWDVLINFNPLPESSGLHYVPIVVTFPRRTDGDVLYGCMITPLVEGPWMLLICVGIMIAVLYSLENVCCVAYYQIFKH